MIKKDNDHIIHFNRPQVPEMKDLQPYLDRIFESRILTNTGPILHEFEEELCKYLGVSHISLFSSGMLALTLALRALGLKGEVITTPFTSVATIQAIYWNNLIPVFVDINENDLNINPEEIEKAITPATCAILPVHIFGSPCDVKKIEEIARRHNLKLIYDAAHCFGVKQNGETICRHGDLSVISFHATKVFNTVEGGAVICKDEETKKYLDALKNTGLNGGYNLLGYGLNAKMNEVQSAFGLAQLKYFDDVILQRKLASLKYRELLYGRKGLGLIPEAENVAYNYSFFPVLLDPLQFGATRDEVADYLMDNMIYTKKYFHPLVNHQAEFSMYHSKPMPVAEKAAANILCLPLYHDITEEEIQRIAGALNINK